MAKAVTPTGGGISGLTFQVSGVVALERALNGIGLKSADLDFKSIAAEGMRLAASYAPRRTGALRASLRASRGKNRASIKAGSTRVPYAGPINYGWGKDKWTGVNRNIQASLFMQRASDQMKSRVHDELTRQLKRAIRGKGLA
jgi:hypothetical protein